MSEFFKCTRDTKSIYLYVVDIDYVRLRNVHNQLGLTVQLSVMNKINVISSRSQMKRKGQFVAADPLRGIFFICTGVLGEKIQNVAIPPSLLV